MKRILVSFRSIVVLLPILLGDLRLKDLPTVRGHGEVTDATAIAAASAVESFTFFKSSTSYSRCVLHWSIPSCKSSHKMLCRAMFTNAAERIDASHRTPGSACTRHFLIADKSEEDGVDSQTASPKAFITCGISTSAKFLINNVK